MEILKYQFFKKIYLFEKAELQRGGELRAYCFPPQMVITAKAGPGQSQIPKLHPTQSHMGAGAQGQLLLPSQAH